MEQELVREIAIFGTNPLQRDFDHYKLHITGARLSQSRDYLAKGRDLLEVYPTFIGLVHGGP